MTHAEIACDRGIGSKKKNLLCTRERMPPPFLLRIPSITILSSLSVTLSPMETLVYPTPRETG